MFLTTEEHKNLFVQSEAVSKGVCHIRQTLTSEEVHLAVLEDMLLAYFRWKCYLIELDHLLI